MTQRRRLFQPNYGEPPARPIVIALVSLAITSTALTYVGDVLFGWLVNRERYDWLIGLNPRNRYLLVATNELDALRYYGIATARLLSSDPVYYLLGFWFGDRMIAWVERRSKGYGAVAKEGKEFFRQVAYPFIFFLPNPIICVLAGASRVRPSRFIVVNLAGTVTVLYLIRRFGEAFSGPISGVVGLIQRYWVVVMILSFVVLAVSLARDFRRKDSEVNVLTDLVRSPDDTATNDTATNDTATNDAATNDAATSDHTYPNRDAVAEDGVVAESKTGEEVANEPINEL